MLPLILSAMLTRVSNLLHWESLISLVELPVYSSALASVSPCLIKYFLINPQFLVSAFWSYNPYLLSITSLTFSFGHLISVHMHEYSAMEQTKSEITFYPGHHRPPSELLDHCVPSHSGFKITLSVVDV